MVGIYVVEWQVMDNILVQHVPLVLGLGSAH